MIELGVKQKLYIDHKTDFGVYLSDTPERNGKSDCVLLPKKQVPQNAKIGDEVEVFVYRDSKDREIATTNMPKLQLGELAVLQVAQVNNIGGFMYWGLEKDLFLPFKEQTYKVKPGDECLVVFASRCIDAWWQSGGIQSPAEARMHDLSDGFAIPGPWSQAAKIEGVSASAVQLRSDDGASCVEIEGRTVRARSPEKIVLDAPLWR